MRNKNLVLAVVGDHSRHKEWIRRNPQFDLILIYYGSSDAVFSDYAKDAWMCIRQKGQKFPLIKSFIIHHRDRVSQYQYVWLPDDDISISTDDLNSLFTIAKDHRLSICQPAVLASDGHVSHEITRPGKGLKLRFTNFVEVMMPLFDVQSLLFLQDDFDLSESGWGLDASWSHRLNHPKDKIAIIDAVVALHTKPVGSDYSRFKIKPMDELTAIIQKYGIRSTPDTYSCIGLKGGLVNRFFHAKYLFEERRRKIKSRRQSRSV